MNRLQIWKEFEGKSKQTQNKIYKYVIGMVKQSGRRNITKDSDIVMNEIINIRPIWSKES
ncbi:hypothetical protein EBZ39_00895 [bacterium]|nr:hypothetical protein [bacterium]